MTIIDSSHPKIQSESSTASRTADAQLDDLPAYDDATRAGPNDTASTHDTEPLVSGGSDQSDSATWRPDATTALNPESRKKLDDEMRRTGRDMREYGLVPEQDEQDIVLPSFESTEIGDRPQYIINGAGDVIS